MLNRRELLKGSLVTSVSRIAFPTATLSFALVPKKARAEVVTIVIAAAAAIAGLIASHNRGDGGLSAFLNAINRKLDIAINQLASLQTGLASVMDALADLPTQVEEIFDRKEVQTLNDTILATAISYGKLLNQRANYTSDPQFRLAPNVMDDINAGLARLEAATSLLIAKNSFGPSTALSIPMAFALEQSLLLLRGDRPGDVAARLKTSLDWLNMAADPLLGSSTASYRAQAALRHEESFAAASANPLGQQIQMRSGQATLACIGINDYRPSFWLRKTCREYNDYHGPSLLAPPSLVREIGFSNVPCDTLVAARKGRHERMFQDYKLVEDEVFADVIVDNKSQRISAGFFGFTLTKTPLSEVLLEGDPSIPPACPIRTIDDPDAAHRRRWLTDRLGESPNHAEFAKLSTLVDLVNLERARISYSTAVLTAMADARTMFVEQLNRLGT